MFNGIGDNGEVKNLQLVDVDYDVKQGGASGGIAWSNYGTITACSVTGTIAAANGGVGGIATSNIGTITACWFKVTACWFKGSITGYRFAGGIAAFNYNDVSACYWNGNVSSGIPSGTDETTKVNDGDSWQTAVTGMNAALTGNDYQWARGTDGLPVLQKKQ